MSFNFYRTGERNKIASEYQAAYRKLWWAPELLRMREQRPPAGTEEGDIYSLSIIMQEIIFRDSPFFIDTESPDGKSLSLIRQHTNIPYRATSFTTILFYTIFSCFTSRIHSKIGLLFLSNSAVVTWILLPICSVLFAQHWRHNDHDSVSNHQPHGCLLNRLLGRRSKKTSKLRVTGLCAGNSPGPVNSPHKGPVTRKMFPFDDVIMDILDILDQVITTEEHMNRPQLPKCEEGEEEMVKLMRDCWAEDPIERPDASDVKKRLRHINHGKYVEFNCVWCQGNCSWYLQHAYL